MGEYNIFLEQKEVSPLTRECLLLACQFGIRKVTLILPKNFDEEFMNLIHEYGLEQVVHIEMSSNITDTTFGLYSNEERIIYQDIRELITQLKNNIDNIDVKERKVKTLEENSTLRSFVSNMGHSKREIKTPKNQRNKQFVKKYHRKG